MKQVNELQSGFVFIKCSKKTHNDCRKIRDALIEKSHGCIQEAFTTNTEIENETWCVAASALIPVSDTAKFRRELLATHTSEKHPTTIKNLKLVLNEQ